MKIGIFDSGLGGLIIAKAIFSAKGGPASGGKNLSAYDYIYLGDTKNLPYGEKSERQIFGFTCKALDFLFEQDCQLVIVACGTASLALRKIQKEYLPKKYPNRRVLGVVVPTLEVADDNHKRKIIGVIGTNATIASHKYKKELTKIDRAARIYEVAAPKLAPLIEQNALLKAENALKLYLEPLRKKGIEALILGCTHYPILKKAAKKILGKKVAVISQDEIIPAKLADYLKRHREISKKLSRDGKKEFLVTNINPGFKKVAKRLFGKDIKLESVALK